MGYRVTVRNEYGVKVATAEAVGALDAMELVQLDGLRA